MTEEELAAIEGRCAMADEMVERLCRGRFETGHRDWLMSIPARPDHDPDLVISAALADVPDLVRGMRECRVALNVMAERQAEIIAERDRLRAALAFARSVIKCGEPWTATCEREINGALTSDS